MSVSEPLFLHTCLTQRAAVPVLHIDLIPSDMHIFVWEQFENLLPHFLAEVQDIILAETQRRRECLPGPCLRLETCQFRIMLYPTISLMSSCV